MVVVVFIALLWLIAGVFVLLGRVVFDEDTARPLTVNFRLLSLIPGILGWLLFILASITSVDAGKVAVPVTFGKAGNPVGSGLHIKPPWTNYHSLSVKVQNYTMSSVAPEGQEQRDDSVPVASKDQVKVAIDSTALFRLTRSNAKTVYVDLGGDYVNDVIRPLIRTAVRDQATPFDAIDLATDKREVYHAAVQAQVEKALGRYGIQLVELQIRDIHLPSELQDAVTAKAKAQQDVQRQAFVLQSKRAQAQQRIVEAEGLAKSQTIIHSTLNPLYNQYLYITELGKLAKSPNTTFLFLPSDPAALPNFQIPLAVK